jgi:hypothetical protein
MIKRVSFWLALTGYFLTFLYYFGPWGIAYSPVLDFILPFWMCNLALGGIPVSAVALFIAPINAVIYGIAGATIGWIFSRFFAESRWEVDRKLNACL